MKRLLALFITVAMAAIPMVVFFTNSTRVAADVAAKSTYFSEVGGSYGIQTLSDTVNGVRFSGTKNSENIYNFRYTYNQTIPVLTDGLDLVFSLDSAVTSALPTDVTWLMIGLLDEGGIGGWGPQNKQGIITALRLNCNDILTSLSYTDGGYPVHSIQTAGTTYSAEPQEFHLTIKKTGTLFEVKVNDVLVGTHSAAADAFSWLVSDTFADGGILSFAYCNNTGDTTTAAAITIKEINGVSMTTAAATPTNTAATPTNAASPTEAPIEPFINGTNSAIATQTKTLTNNGYVFSGTYGNPQNYAFSFNKKINLSEDGFKLVMSFDKYVPANQFFTIILSDIQGWNGWNNTNLNKGLALIVRPSDSFVEIHEMTGSAWPTHVGDMSKDFEITKGKAVTFEMKKVGDYFKFYINNVEMTQFKDKNYGLYNKYFTNGAYLTLSTLNFNEDKNLIAAATIKSINKDVFASNLVQNPTTGDNSLWYGGLMIFMAVSVILVIIAKKKAITHQG